MCLVSITFTHAVMNAWLSLSLSPEQQQGDQLTRCVENASKMRACHSHALTHTQEQMGV